MKNGKRRSWTTDDVRTLKTLARKRTTAGKIAMELRHTKFWPSRYERSEIIDADLKSYRWMTKE